MKDYLQRLRGDLISEGTPYGFTLIIWGAGGIAIHIYGTLSIAGVFLFISAPLIAYGIMVLILVEFLSELSKPPIPAQQSSGLSYIDLFSVLPAVACAYGLYLIIPNSLGGLPAGSGVATIVYNLILAAQRTVSARIIGEQE